MSTLFTPPTKELEIKQKTKLEIHFTYDEVLVAARKYFRGDDLAANVWINKYALRDLEGRFFELTPDDMHRRIAKEIFRIEKKYSNPLSEEQIYGLLKGFQFIVPQGGPMTGIGNPFQVSSLSNCFVIGNPADSYGGIMQTDEEQIQLMKRRGGVGHDLSHIRPEGSRVRNSALSSTGIVPFMERYSNSTREVAQGGRRGALMLSFSIKHPNVESFIDAKLDTTKVTGANISVRIDDQFMEAVKNKSNYSQQYPVDDPNPQVKKEVPAQQLWDMIVQNAWQSAEPGILFWDTIIRESIPDCYADLGFKTVSTNPCGEIPLCAYDSCRLLAINLFHYVDEPFTSKAIFNFEKFRSHVKIAQRIMDDIVDLELEKIDTILRKLKQDPESMHLKGVEIRLWKKIRKKCIEGRRTGVGITAEADMLAALGLKYGTDEALEKSVEIHKELTLSAYRSSVDLARERGAFPIYDSEREINNPFINRIKEADPDLYHDMIRYGRRNIALLTIAPTGTTSLMTQTSSGIEPVFQVFYKRRRKVNPSDEKARVDFIDESGDHWEEYTVIHPRFLDWLEVKGVHRDEILNWSESKLREEVALSPYHLATANDIDWIQKVRLQGAVQKWVDHSISVTVNVPEKTTVDVVNDIFLKAWETGCKGITIYREGSRTGVLINEPKGDDSQAQFTDTLPPRRPKKLEAEILRFQNDYEKWIAVIGLYDEKPYEIFTGRAEDTFVIPTNISKCWVVKEKNGNGKNRYDFQYLDSDGYRVTMEGLSRSFDKEFWNYAKLISGILRHGMPLPYVVELISDLHLGNGHINTWKNGVVRALKNFIPDGTKAVKESCKQCGDHEGLQYKEGCLTCTNCGHSDCG